jgi:hypothetical protein
VFPLGIGAETLDQSLEEKRQQSIHSHLQDEVGSYTSLSSEDLPAGANHLFFDASLEAVSKRLARVDGRGEV